MVGLPAWPNASKVPHVGAVDPSATTPFCLQEHLVEALLTITHCDGSEANRKCYLLVSQR